MNHLEEPILHILRKHRGRNNPVTCHCIEKITGSSSRTVRRTISDLVKMERALIASSVNYPYGFYLITNKHEAKTCLRQYYSRAKEVLNRARILNKMVKKKFGVSYQKEFYFVNQRKSST